MTLLLSQIGIYHLQLLAKLVRKKSGLNHRLSDRSSMIDLLNYSCTSTDAEIYEAFSRFSNDLDENQRNYLKDHGLLIPPPILFESNNPQNFGQVAQ